MHACIHIHTHIRTLTKTHIQIAAMREGFCSVVPALVLPLLTWREIEMKVCGTADIDVDALKKITEHNLPGKDKHPLAIKFWNVVKSFSNDDRAALLGFAWGRRRLPAGACMYACMYVPCMCVVYECGCAHAKYAGFQSSVYTCIRVCVGYQTEHAALKAQY